jgi:Cu(I)/Ag(I) efflux system membrane fusion protein
MKKTVIAATALAIALLAVSGWGLYRLGQRHAPVDVSATAPSALPAAMPAGAAASAQEAAPQSIAQGEDATRRHIKAGIRAGDTDPANGRKVLYYHDPMVPASKFDQPAKSPFMDMMLVPVYEGGSGGADTGRITVSPRIQQNLGVRTAQVTEGTLAPQLAAVGSIAFNEREQAVVQARATGYVEKLKVRATLDRVSRGQVLAELYVPDWVAAQEEFLALRRMASGVRSEPAGGLRQAQPGPGDSVRPGPVEGLAALVDGARVRMKLAGMSDAQIQQVERTGKPDARIAITAPISGLVTELAVREGMTVMPGATLFRINGFGTVWANAEVPESQAALLRPGIKVQAQAPALPGVAFDGRVEALLPDVNAATRTLKARVELANPRGQLVPGMFVSMQFTGQVGRPALLVPTEAVIQTGRRAVVLLAEDNGRFRPVEVRTGAESGGQTEIAQGLQAGQRVVISSQFLIDSEASLKGVESRLNATPGAVASAASSPAAASAAAAPSYHTEAKVEAIAPDALTLSHPPIPALKWGAMTMDFKPPAQLPPGLKAGDRIGIDFQMTAEGLPQIMRIAPAGATAAAAGGGK